MVIGVPKEIKADENRVGIVPAGVRVLTQQGHTVVIERDAGKGCRISNDEFSQAGAEIVESPNDVYGAADMIMKVKEPLEQEYPLLRENQIIFAYLHLAPAATLTQAMLTSKVIGIAYETIQLPDRSLPLLIPMSEVAGRMSVQVGAHFLEETQGGRGVLLGGVPGVRRGRVTIIGAGTVGRSALKIAVGMGADVYVLDVDQARLVQIDDLYGNRVTTMISHFDNIWEAVVNSHLVIGGVLIPGGRTPTLVSRDMIRAMKSGTVIIDVAVDQGGCVETSRPTAHSNPTFVVDEVIHYCVPNMPGAVARTSTFALTNVTLTYALKLANQGFDRAVAEDEALAHGVNVYKGFVTHEKVAQALHYSYTPLKEVACSAAASQ